MIETAYRVNPLRSGDPVRLGDYPLVGRLGAGGMGTVYLAERADGGYVAIKVIHAALGADPEFAARFRKEVARARQVPPYCTARFLDADLEHEPPYLVVEYVDGPSLIEVVAERGPLEAGALHSLAVGVATALAGIHGAGVIHRDLKPGNVLLPAGSTKVIDFGLARPFEVSSELTAANVMVGTVTYLAPERMTGQPSEVTAAADIFSWGCVVAYAGTGRTPFQGDSPSATAGRILTQPPDLDGLPEPLRRPVLRALSKDPADRPTAAELLDLLMVTGSAATGVAVRPARTRRRRSRLVLVGAAVVTAAVLLGAGAVGYVAHLHDDRTPTGTAATTSTGPTASTTRTGPITGPGAASYCVDVDTNTNTSGNKVQLWDCNGVTGQQWTLAADGTVRAFDKCLDIAGNSTADHALVDLWDCNGLGGQQWRHRPDGSLLNPRSGRCLDDPGGRTGNGIQLQIWDCNGRWPQVWHFP